MANHRNLITLLLILLTGFAIKAQELTGTQLLERTIAYHDPNDSWPTFQGQLSVTMSMPDKSERVSDITIKLPQEYFQLIAVKDENVVSQKLDKDNCELSLNGNTEISEALLKKHRLSCERAKMMKDYYTYLYGLPMKLKDSGTILDPEVQTKKFKGKEYLVLKVTYEKEVGEDIWYFYFDPTTYAMEVYQFFHDESINDGEYILLDGIETVLNIKMPKTRAWYYNKNDKHLGTDVLTSASSF